MIDGAEQIYIAAPHLRTAQMHKLNDAPPRRAMAVQAFIDWAGISRTEVYELIAAG